MVQHIHLAVSRRWLTAIGFIMQFALIITLFFSLQQPSHPEIILRAVPGRPALCQIESIALFSNPWLLGVDRGTLVRPLSGTSATLPCQQTSPVIRIQIIGPATTWLPDHSAIIRVSSLPVPPDPIKIVLAVILVIVFTLMGTTILLRAQNRVMAHIAYALFYVASLIFGLFNIATFNILWANILLYILLMIERGLVTTFVCLFPYHATSKQAQFSDRQVLPYIPLFISVILAIISLPLALYFPLLRPFILLVTFFYNLVCLVLVIWVLIRGLNRLEHDERQVARMVIISSFFLLMPLALSLNVLPPNALEQESLIRLSSIPITLLPIVSGYLLMHQQLSGTMRLLGRHVMRISLWILLATLFIFPVLIAMNIINSYGKLPTEYTDYLYAALLLLCLCLFPLIWNKVRNLGDQVFYGDFYEYNRSLHDLSTALTRLQGLDQICAFVLPRLTSMLKASDAALLIRSGTSMRNNTSNWRIYQHSAQQTVLTRDRLIGVAQLALVHSKQASYEPQFIDNILLLPLYDSTYLTGFLCLGQKMNFEPYSRQDTSFLATLTAQLSVLEVNNRYLEQAQTNAEKLTALNRRVISAQEDERRHLALELHDDVLQQAMLLVRQLSDAGTMADVATAMPLARSIVTKLRQTCLELRPPLLDELGLQEALYWLARHTEQQNMERTHIQFISTGSLPTRPSARIELAFYRVVQEALSNALKYAGASRVIIRLHYSQRGRISLLIIDNGRGFKKERLLAESLGLVGMHERMSAIGGHLQLRTSPGQGVVIRAICTCPSVSTQNILPTEIEQHPEKMQSPEQLERSIVGE